ncbi:hypothetical protein JG687_00009625 [Phytophthora cactorum]|uniref:BZIP domain-containing protein n=1 Tax=Phytophthora cactorum TaxID=29920 RepID=A0A8T1UB60_9STRA|nr:hypothetical protein JG687_00009625 [Phytophthora cactorum]
MARERHRLSQQRYRKKRYSHMAKLESETCKLREEIKMLEHKHRAVISSAPAAETVWKVAIEYFRLFRHGLPLKGNDSTALDFVQDMMAPDVIHNSGCGAEAMIRSWRRLSNWFEDVELKFERLEKSAEGSIVATTTTSITINEVTVRNVFPRLHNSRNHKGRSRQTQKLLGQRIVMHGSTRFEWDSAFDRVTSVVGHSDLLTPMLRLLGNVEDVTIAFEDSRVRPDFR